MALRTCSATAPRRHSWQTFATWHVVEITPAVAATARRLLLQHSLRSGDALQLASALVLQTGLGTPLVAFVAYDHRLLEAARAEQLVTVGR